MDRFRKNERFATSHCWIKKHIFLNCSSVNSCLRHFVDSPFPIWKLCKTRFEPRLVQMRYLIFNVFTSWNINNSWDKLMLHLYEIHDELSKKYWQNKYSSIFPFIREMNPLEKTNPLGSNHSKSNPVIFSSNLFFWKGWQNFWNFTQSRNIYH